MDFLPAGRQGARHKKFYSLAGDTEAGPLPRAAISEHGRVPQWQPASPTLCGGDPDNVRHLARIGIAQVCPCGQFFLERIR